MAFTATVNIAGKDHRVLNCTHSVSRQVDATGRVSSIIKAEPLYLEIEVTDDTSIIDWANDQFALKDGKVTFKKRDQDSTMKEVSWKGGQVIRYEENYVAHDDHMHVAKIWITMKELHDGSVKIKNPQV